jgi:hypothetical protein
MAALNRTAFDARCSFSELSFEPGARRRIRIHLRPLHQARADRIHANVRSMPFVVMLVANPMVREALLPYESSLCLTEPERKPAFDQLQRAFKRNFRSGREEKVQMIGHDYELMQDIPHLLAIMEQHVHHQFGRLSMAEQGCALPGHSCNEECSIFHSGML